MASMDVADLLNSLREHGTIDSQGEFTVALSDARRKLTEFRSSNRTRYLVLLLSAGIGAGARRVSIRRDGGASYRLLMPGAYLPESALLGTYARGAAGSPSAFDLVLGLQSAFAEGARRVEVVVRHPQEPSFGWILQESTEESRALESGSSVLEILIEFPESWQERLSGFFSRLGGYVGQPEEMRYVEQLCDHASVPILLNDYRVDRPYFMNERVAVARVGGVEGPQESSSTPVLDLPEFAWRGWITLGAGSLVIVVNGVTMARVESPDLNGLVLHDGLRRDLTRENLVLDETYESLERDWVCVERALLQKAAELVPTLSTQDVLKLFPRLFSAGLRQDISTQGFRNLVDWLAQKSHPPYTEPLADTDLLGVSVQLLTRIRRHPGFERFASFERWMVRESSHALQEQPTRVAPILEATLEAVGPYYPHQTLVRGYILLGLGAYCSSRGDETKAQQY